MERREYGAGINFNWVGFTPFNHFFFFHADSIQLLHLEKVIQNNRDCIIHDPIPKDIITEGMMCAIAPSGVGDACQGDSGGPLVCKRGSKYELAGAVSFGNQCSKMQRSSGVYADVYYFMPWIKSTTGL